MAGVKGGGRGGRSSSSSKEGARRSRTNATAGSGTKAAAPAVAAAAAGSAVVNTRGKRTAVQIVLQGNIPRRSDGLEDEDALFAAAKSPPPDVLESQKNNVSDDNDEQQHKVAQEKKSNKNEQSLAPKTTKSIRFSLDQSQQEQGPDDLSSITRPGRVAQKVKSTLSRGSMSPSELSLVSTAPPLANVSHEEEGDADDYDDDNAITNTPVHGNEDMEQDGEEEQKTEEEEQQATPMDQTPRGFQLGSEEESQTPIASAVKDTPQQAQDEDGAADDEDDDDDGFPVPVDDHDEDESNSNLEEQEQDDDDLIPPPPPDSPERDDSEPLDEEEGEGANANVNAEQEQAEVPTQDGALSNDEDESPAGAPPDDESQSDNDQDMAASGSEMADPKTPASSIRKGRFSRKVEESTAGKRKRDSEKEPEETQKKKKKHKNDKDNKKKKKHKKGAASSEESDEDDADAAATPSSVVPKKKKKTTSRFATRFSPKGIPLAQEYETIPLSDLKPEDGTPPEGLRRSRRTRVAPLAFWKNEKPEYGANDDDEAPSDLINMPIVKAYIRALDTPYKPRRVVPSSAAEHRGKQKGKTAGTATASSSNRHAAMPLEPFDSSRLRAKLDVIDGDEGRLWDDNIEEATDMKIVAYKSRMEARKLPLVKNRTKAEGKVVGKAAQAFNVPNGAKEGYAGYIMGNLTLPPKGIKDAESVGSCSQTFTVVTGQPGALEIAYADPDEDENGNLSPETALRFLLGPGDMFRVPPGNCYRLQNHSKTESCFLTWTIIRPVTLDNHQSQGGSPSSSVGGQSSKY